MAATDDQALDIAVIDPELQPLLDFLPAVRLDPEGLPTTRATIAALAERASTEGVVAGVERRERHVSRANGDPVRALLYRPIGVVEALPAILHMHSGGYMVGVPEGRDAMSRHWASSLGALIVSVDYRLAPEHPYPAALDDCYAVLAWLHKEADGLAIDCTRIVAMGESAGGGLCAGLALRARDQALYGLAGQAMLYPMLDDRTGLEVSPPQGHWVWTGADNVAAWQALLGGSAEVSPYAAPARATDLRGLPPAFIGVGALDLFLAEDLDYGRRLAEAGVAVDLHVYAGAYHSFDAAVEANVSKRLRSDLEVALRKMLRIVKVE